MEQRLFRSSYYPLQAQSEAHNNFHPYYLEKSRTCQKLLKGNSLTSHSKTVFNKLWSLCILQQAHLLVKSKADYWCSMPTPMLPKGTLESATTTKNISSNSSFLYKSCPDGAGERSELLKASCNSCDTGCLGWLRNRTRSRLFPCLFFQQEDQELQEAHFVAPWTLVLSPTILSFIQHLF